MNNLGIPADKIKHFIACLLIATLTGLGYYVFTQDLTKSMLVGFITANVIGLGKELYDFLTTKEFFRNFLTKIFKKDVKRGHPDVSDMLANFIGSLGGVLLTYGLIAIYQFIF